MYSKYSTVYNNYYYYNMVLNKVYMNLKLNVRVISYKVENHLKNTIIIIYKSNKHYDRH